ncbi:class I SAM-dependent methyltransferase [Halorhodospira abdelmalekii]|uniref:class I SAM-dependent methyltransferase n=1 Tax=Halorhodospira abdelmalekii TaxID=421629 RepID=UPI0019057733|nr:class I SAM-dependent methyltransferase [Halorhodospira abdelmalekii]
MHSQTRDEGARDPGLLGVLDVGGGPECAAQWGRRLGVPCYTERPAGCGVLLCVAAPPTPPGLQLNTAKRTPRPVAIDFTAPALLRRLATTSVHRDPLIRAVGLQRHRDLRILDGTAGLGQDGWILAHLGAPYGAELTWVERSPTLAALLADALQRATAAEEAAIAATAARIRLIHTELERHLGKRRDDRDELNQREEQNKRDERCERLEPEDRVGHSERECVTQSDSQSEAHLDAQLGAQWDVVYLDPMYPAHSTRGAVGREAQTLRALLHRATPEPGHSSSRRIDRGSSRGGVASRGRGLSRGRGEESATSPTAGHESTKHEPTSDSAAVAAKVGVDAEAEIGSQAETAPAEAQLLQSARTTARLRVVVKRPHRAAALGGIEPTRSVTGRTLRFDVYEA